MTPRVVTAALTDIGRRRADNQDRWIVRTPVDGEGGAVLLVVCDGMGGARAGEIASALAIETVVRAFREHAARPAAEALALAIEAANREVWTQGQERLELRGMGTTCTAAAIEGDALSLGHVGDSRAYLVRDGALRRLTRDHSLVGHLVATGQITEDDARHDPRRNVVTRSIGAAAAVEVDAWSAGPVHPGDTVILCSDGLHGLVGDEDIARHAAGPDLEAACRELVALANDRGGPDNITVVLARVRP
jgi:PPM family protein phosphatase